MGSARDPRRTKSYVLKPEEAVALDTLAVEPPRFLPLADLRGTISRLALDRLVDLGLVEIGVACPTTGIEGWRIADNGWVCMFGRTGAEIRNMRVGAKFAALRVWQWPPSTQA